MSQTWKSTIVSIEGKEVLTRSSKLTVFAVVMYMNIHIYSHYLNKVRSKCIKRRLRLHINLVAAVLFPYFARFCQFKT